MAINRTFGRVVAWAAWPAPRAKHMSATPMVKPIKTLRSDCPNAGVRQSIAKPEIPQITRELAPSPNA
jgi:hypothetical protein